jgi:hypothetical protein
MVSVSGHSRPRLAQAAGDAVDGAFDVQVDAEHAALPAADADVVARTPGPGQHVEIGGRGALPAGAQQVLAAGLRAEHR